MHGEDWPDGRGRSTGLLVIVAAALALPTCLCLAFQALSVTALMMLGHFKLSTVLLMLFGYPAIGLGVSAVWNLRCLLAMSTRAADSPSHGASRAEGTLIAVVLVAGFFFPAGFILQRLSSTPVIGGAAAITVQYLLDGCLIWMLARLLDRFEGPGGQNR